MKFEIKRAVPKEAEGLYEIMQLVADGMEHPEWFVQDDLTYIQAHMGHMPLQKQDAGFILKAVDEAGNTAGFFMVAFPGLTGKNLGHHLELKQKQLLTVAHMDSVVILPEFRGNGLQYKLIQKAEEVLREETDYRIFMATVHPDNTYSLQNVLSLGYEVVAEALKYGGYRRYILKKEI